MRRSIIHRARFEANEAKVADLDNALARTIAYAQARSAAIPLHQQEPVVLESVKTKLQDDTRIEPMTAPTEDVVVDTISLNNSVMCMANTSPVYCTADDRLLERNNCTSDTKGELTSPEQLKFLEAISKAMCEELAPLIANRDQTAVQPTTYRSSKDGTIDEMLLVMKRYQKRAFSNTFLVDKAWAIIDQLGDKARSYIINKPESERDFPREG